MTHRNDVVAEPLHVTGTLRFAGVAKAGATVGPQGDLRVSGVIEGTVRLEPGAWFTLAGVGGCDLVVAAGARAVIRGIHSGRIQNRGGEVLVAEGALIKVGGQMHWVRPGGVLEAASGEQGSMTVEESSPLYRWEEDGSFTPSL